MRTKETRNMITKGTETHLMREMLSILYIPNSMNYSYLHTLLSPRFLKKKKDYMLPFVVRPSVHPSIRLPAVYQHLLLHY